MSIVWLNILLGLATAFIGSILIRTDTIPTKKVKVGRYMFVIGGIWMTLSFVVALLLLDIGRGSV